MAATCVVSCIVLNAKYKNTKLIFDSLSVTLMTHSEKEITFLPNSTQRNENGILVKLG
jgi:hypothetical protein